MAAKAAGKRRKGFAALGISVLDSDECQDQKDIKLRGHANDAERASRNELDLQTQVLKNRSKDQAQLLAIVAGLQEGIEDLLAGRVYHPKKEEEDDKAVSQSSETESEGPGEPANSLEDVKEVEKADADAYTLKKNLAGMPMWIEHEVQSDEESIAAPAEEGSDGESTGSFLRIPQHDIEDWVQEVDDQKFQQEVGWGRAATNRIMYEWKEYARVKIMEEVNQWFQHRSWAAEDEASKLEETEAESREMLANEHESIRALKTAIERKEIALVSSVSSFRQNMEKRIEQHWAAKRKARDQAIAQVQREEEERRQERLRRQAERAAKKFTDIDDQIADLKDSIEQVKGEIHKKELMKHTYPTKRRASAGAGKAGDVLAVISAQQEEAQILSGKLAMASQKLETLEDALEKGKAFFSSAAFKSKKVRSLPADDPAGEVVNEEMTEAMKAVLAQLMIEDESLAELISTAIGLANSPAGKNRTRNGLLRLDDIFGEKDSALSDPKVPADEIVASNDPEERKRKLQEIEAECARLQEEIENLSGGDHILPDPIPLEEDAQKVKLQTQKDEAIQKLLSKATAARSAMNQKKAATTQAQQSQSYEPSGIPTGGDSSADGEGDEEEARKHEESDEYAEATRQMEEQKVRAAELSLEAGRAASRDQLDQSGLNRRSLKGLQPQDPQVESDISIEDEEVKEPHATHAAEEAHGSGGIDTRGE